jgi:hypothetical protein
VESDPDVLPAQQLLELAQAFDPVVQAVLLVVALTAGLLSVRAMT